MKGDRYVDIGSILDKIFETIGAQVKEGIGADFSFDDLGFSQFGRDDNPDLYPNFSYPPMNIYLTTDRTMVFELAVAGFDESDISLSFQGDYMVFSAKISVEPFSEPARYFKRRLRLKDIEKQKYYVPAEKFDQSAVKAVFKNGILRVSIPAKEEDEQTSGVKIEIVKEGE